MARIHSWCRFFIFVLLAALSSGCQNPPSPPAPNQPMIAAGALLGHRVCGNFALPGETLSFDCDALPTRNNTGWQLTPLAKTDGAGRTVVNAVVDLTITTPSLTNLIVEYESPSGHASTLTQLASAQSVPKNVGPRGEVGVAATDNGTVKTWTLQFTMSPCTDLDQVDIFDVNANGTRATNPLIVYFVRDPAETGCDGSAGAIISVSPASSSGGATGSTGTTRCPQLGVCVNCSSGHPPDANRWSASEACSLADYLKTYGYENPNGTLTASGMVCTVRAEPTREQCETKP